MEYKTTYFELLLLLLFVVVIVVVVVVVLGVVVVITRDTQATIVRAHSDIICFTVVNATYKDPCFSTVHKL
jgi:uncharacterized membrane protein YqjE